MKDELAFQADVYNRREMVRKYETSIEDLRKIIAEKERDFLIYRLKGELNEVDEYAWRVYLEARRQLIEEHDQKISRTTNTS